MTTLKKILMSFAVGVATLLAIPSRAQQPPPTGTIQGKANDELGSPVKDGEVRLTSDVTAPAENRKYTFTFKTDATGNYKGEGIPTGTAFNVVLFRQGKSVDFIAEPKQPNIASPQTWKAGEAKTLNFDMSSADFMSTLTPERRKEIEEFRAKNAAAMDINKVVSQLNATLKTVRGDLTAAAAPAYGDVSKDVDLMKQATDAKPEEPILWITYGDALKAQGDHLGHADVAQHKPVTGDDDAMKVYSSAVDAYKKSADLNAASKKPTPTDQAVAYNQMGNVLATQHKTPDAVAAFDNAAKLDPTKAGMYYNNEAAVLTNNNAATEAGAAADKAIAAEPTRADPYYIKGQSLIGQSKLVNGKLVPPAGCVEAYQKYLELAPDGKFSGTVKEVLASLGQTVTNKYKAGKK